MVIVLFSVTHDTVFLSPFFYYSVLPSMTKISSLMWQLTLVVVIVVGCSSNHVATVARSRVVVKRSYLMYFYNLRL